MANVGGLGSLLPKSNPEHKEGFVDTLTKYAGDSKEQDRREGTIHRLSHRSEG
jgi:hypothetical protein